MGNVIIELAKQPILGVVVGALIALLTTHVLDRRRWKREDQARFHLDKIEIYSELLQAATLVFFDYTVLSSMQAEPERDSHHGEMLKRFMFGYNDLLGKMSKIEFISSREVIETARAIRDSAKELFTEMKMAEGGTVSRQVDWELYRNKLQPAFVSAARAELGISQAL
jgi:hypothetical protein